MSLFYYYSMQTIFHEVDHKPLKGVTIYGIASGATSSDIGFVSHKIKDDERNQIDFQIDSTIHFEKLPTRVISPQQLCCQPNRLSYGFHVARNEPKLIIHGFQKTVSHDPETKLSTLCKESDIEKIHNLATKDKDNLLVQDGGMQDNITHGQ